MTNSIQQKRTPQKKDILKIFFTLFLGVISAFTWIIDAQAADPSAIPNTSETTLPKSPTPQKPLATQLKVTAPLRPLTPQLKATAPLRPLTPQLKVAAPLRPLAPQLKVAAPLRPLTPQLKVAAPLRPLAPQLKAAAPANRTLASLTPKPILVTSAARPVPGVANSVVKNPAEPPQALQKLSTPLVLKKRNFRLTPELGFSTLNYSETGISAYSAALAVVKVGALYKLPYKNFQLYGTTAYSGLSQLANTPSIGVGIIALNAGLDSSTSYRSWTLDLKTGWYYTSMLVTKSDFGYNGLYGLQVIPSVTQIFTPAIELGAYFKFGPALGTTHSSNSANSIGLSWSQRLPDHETLKINLEYSFTNLLIQTSTITEKTISLSFSYSGWSWAF